MTTELGGDISAAELNYLLRSARTLRQKAIAESLTPIGGGVGNLASRRQRSVSNGVPSRACIERTVACQRRGTVYGGNDASERSRSGHYIHQYFSSRRSVTRVTVTAHTFPICFCALDTARIANSRDSRSTRFLFMAFPRHKVYEMAKPRSSS
jgi:hypothetical protein